MNSHYPNPKKMVWNFLAVIAVAGVLVLSSERLQAQSPAKSPAVSGQNRLAHLNQLSAKLGPGIENKLSTGGATMFHLAKLLADQPMMMNATHTVDARKAMTALSAKSKAKMQAMIDEDMHKNSEEESQEPIPVNDSELDYTLSRIAGFTQSETSNAWCGGNVVAGFNDSGAFVRSTVANMGGQSFSGVAVSHNQGRSFLGLPLLNPGTGRTFLGGDPSIVCSDASHFLYASLLSEATVDSSGNNLLFTGISINASTDGGLTWGSPIPAVLKDASISFVDKEWMAIDHANSKNVYVTYTIFEQSGVDTVCPGGQVGRQLGPTVRIEIVASKDGGNTWGTPVIVDRTCGLKNTQNLSGSQVAVGLRGEVYVAYASLDGATAEIRFRKSVDGGAVFQPTVIAAEATQAAEPVNGLSFLQGGFRTNSFPALSIDTSGSLRRGTLYLAWTDASRNKTPDIGSFRPGIYAFGDIVLSSSKDGGATWSTPRVVSPTPDDFAGAGRDQFMPGVAVDSHGALAVCYSDRRNDPNNFAIDHFCSLSRDGGNSFEDIRETPVSWSPAHATDAFINAVYLGDYDTVSGDATGAHPGFFSTFQVQTNSNPDVFGMRLTD